MSQKNIREVLDAEREADAIRERAAEEARTRRETCETAEIRRSEERIAAEREAARRREEEVRARAEVLVAQSREEAGEDIAVLQSAASAKMREAVKHIEWKLCDI